MEVTMSKREYEWDSIDNPPIIKAHSLNKHSVITSYLSRYIEKLYSNSRGYIRLSIVDGFAGGGIYLNEVDLSPEYGSPVKIMKTVSKAEAELPVKFGKKVSIKTRYYFVEKDKKAVSVLQKVLNREKLTPFKDEYSQIIEGDILDHWYSLIDKIKSEGKTHRALFILDQYGYKDVPLFYIQELFKLMPKAEVILTFAVDWLIDYLSDKPIYIDRCQRRLQSLGVDLDVKDIVHTKKSKQEGEGRLIIQDLLSEELSKNCGAKYFTRYFIRSTGKGNKDSHRDIWLVHMSQHDIARDEMAKVHWNEANHISTHSGFQGLDDSGLIRLGYSTRLDEKVLGQINLNYNFDKEKNYNDSKHILLNQIPDIIWRMSSKGSFQFSELMAEIANHTPASSDLMKDVIHYLLESKDIIVQCPKKGTRRQKGNAIQFCDVIKVCHKSIFFDGLK
jgi:three-Cys-motif partner protein